MYRGGYANTQSEETIETWDEFVDLCSTPIVGPKNGDYFIRGFCPGPRCDSGMASLDLIIIDGDQSLEDSNSCVPPGKVHDVLKALDLTHCIYTSFSNDLINNRHKWRMVIPSDDLIDAAALTEGVAEVISILHSAGLPVKNVPENLVLSQPWFLPRCKEEAFDDFYSAWHDGQPYHIGSVPILDTAGIGNNSDTANGGKASFAWDYVFDQFRRGTIHQGMKAAAGWLIRTTDWADKQIVDYLLALVDTMCPDTRKNARARDGEALSLVQYCRKKSGIIVNNVDVSWRGHCVTAAELRVKEFLPLRWAVEELIPEGLTILAGDPKAGKSLMAVDICSAITSGGAAFGKRACKKGGAIYISLEDPERRVKDRIARQCDEWPESFRLVTGGISAPILPSLEEMVAIYPDTRCIIIDTLQYIVPPKPVNISEYSHYYSVLGPLHDFALAEHVAIICITHKRKDSIISGDNPFASILGSAAISGTADAMLMLAKNHAKGKTIDPAIPDGFLHVIGREVESDCLQLEFDGERMVWTVISDIAGHVVGNANWLLISKALQQSPLTARAISERASLNYSTVRSCLARMAKQNLVQYDNGVWLIPNREYKSSAW